MPIRVNFVHQNNDPHGQTLVDATFVLDCVPSRTDKVVFNQKAYTVCKVIWHLPTNQEKTVLIELND